MRTPRKYATCTVQIMVFAFLIVLAVIIDFHGYRTGYVKGFKAGVKEAEDVAELEKKNDPLEAAKMIDPFGLKHFPNKGKNQEEGSSGDKQ